MSPEDAEEYTQALGQVTAGGFRQVALGERLGVPTALGLSTREWVERRLGGYIRMSIPERREAVAELTDEGMSKPAIAEVLGVDERTVARDRAMTNAIPEPKEPTPTQSSPVANVIPAELEDQQATITLDQIDPDGAERQRQAELIAAWSKAHAALAKKVADLNSFPVEDVAVLLDDVGRLNARTGIDLLRDYCTRMETTLRASDGLHIVGGR